MEISTTASLYSMHTKMRYHAHILNMIFILAIVSSQK